MPEPCEAEETAVAARLIIIAANEILLFLEEMELQACLEENQDPEEAVAGRVTMTLVVAQFREVAHREGKAQHKALMNAPEGKREEARQACLQWLECHRAAWAALLAL